MKLKTKINDFGQKIGGAKKDWWITGNLTAEELNKLSLAEQKKFASKDCLWPPITVEDCVEEADKGIDPFVLYWRRIVRRHALPKPLVSSEKKHMEQIVAYVNDMIRLKTAVESVKTQVEISQFYDLAGSFSCAILSGEILKISMHHKRMYANMKNSGFPYGEKGSKKKKSVNRKKNFTPLKLLSIQRSGEDYRRGISIDEYLWQRKFNSYGVEFGQWLTEKDKQASLNYCYDAFMDLAMVLGISDKDISFNNRLSMAFGSRGGFKGSAHYEPRFHVINLTKMHGAGCTAHEWFHALDNFLAESCGITDTVMASESKQKEKLPVEFVNLIQALQRDVDGEETEFYKGSVQFGTHYAKDAHGYWESKCEMAARAFGCYVKDNIGVSDYLIAHADSYVFETENESTCAIPQDEERELFDELFDYLFIRLKKDGFFTPRSETVKVKKTLKSSKFPYEIIREHSGQLRFIVE